MPSYLTAKQLAERLNVRPETVRSWYRQGVVPGHWNGKRLLLFTWAEVEAVLKATGNAPQKALR